MKSKLTAAEDKLSDYRNDYFLAVETVNAMQEAYYSSMRFVIDHSANFVEDLNDIMLGIDGHFHAKLRDLLGTYSSLESEYSTSLKAGMEIVLAQVVKINQGADMADFLLQHATIFETQDDFLLECYEGDMHRDLVITDANLVTLGFKLSRLVSTYDELQALVAKKEREVNGLESIIEVYSKTPAFGNADSPMEVLFDP